MPRLVLSDPVERRHARRRVMITSAVALVAAIAFLVAHANRWNVATHIAGTLLLVAAVVSVIGGLRDYRSVHRDPRR